MRRLIYASCIVVAVACAIWPSGQAFGQTVDHGNVEFTVMNGAAILTGPGSDVSALLTPVPPVWRLSFWTPSALTVDLGFSLLHGSADNADLTLLSLEGGLGANLAARNASFVPFVGGVAGLISVNVDSDSDSEFYVGGKVGLRTFIRDYAAVRVQGGYRHLMLDGEDVGIIEIVGGLSFFL